MPTAQVCAPLYLLDHSGLAEMFRFVGSYRQVPTICNVVVLAAV